MTTLEAEIPKEDSPSKASPSIKSATERSKGKNSEEEE